MKFVFLARSVHYKFQYESIRTNAIGDQFGFLATS